MNFVWIIAAIFITLVGVLATMATFTLLVACAPNSTDQQAAWLGRLMILTLAVGGLGLVASITLLVLGRAGWAATAGAVPILAGIATIAYLWAAG